MAKETSEFVLVDPAPAAPAARTPPSTPETIVLHRHVKEWLPQAPETLPEIEQTIDSWGRGTTTSLQERTLDPEEVRAKVDRLTRRVKSRRKQTITETVTEWVEGPVGSGPLPVEEPLSEAPAASAWEAPPEERSRPARRFSLFRRKAKPAKAADGALRKEKAPAGTTAEKEYRPQCVALTADGAQCRNSAREDSKYCISHFGYQPPTTKGLAQRIEGDAWDPDDKLTDRASVRAVDTLPAVANAPDTRLRTRKKARKAKPSRKKR